MDGMQPCWSPKKHAVMGVQYFSKGQLLRILMPTPSQIDAPCFKHYTLHPIDVRGVNTNQVCGLTDRSQTSKPLVTSLTAQRIRNATFETHKAQRLILTRLAVWPKPGCGTAWQAVWFWQLHRGSHTSNCIPATEILQRSLPLHPDMYV